jgi:hypothetical protein
LKGSSPLLEVLKGLEQATLPGLAEEIYKGDIDAVRWYALCDATRWHRGYSLPA